MSKVIINADDFGYSNGINYGIIDCYKDGVVTSTTLMTNMPGVNHAVNLAKENNKLGVGVHLTITCGKPLKSNLTTLINEEGNFRKLSSYNVYPNIDLNQLYEEWEAQIKKFLSFGLLPTHLDSHHHMHAFKENIQVAEFLAKKYSLPLRNSNGILDNSTDIKTTEMFIDDFDQAAILKKDGNSEKNTEDFLENKFNELLKYNTVEVMCHPGYLDKSIIENSSFSMPRYYEVNILTKSTFAKKLKESGEISLINYKDI